MASVERPKMRRVECIARTSTAPRDPRAAACRDTSSRPPPVSLPTGMTMNHRGIACRFHIGLFRQNRLLKS
eukprot:3973526-Prymnesium_polylepis.2